MIPIVCFLPGTIDSTLGTFFNTENQIIALIAVIMYRCWGVLTLYGFKFFKPANNSDEENDLNSSMNKSIPKKDPNKITIQLINSASFTSNSKRPDP